MSDTGTKNILFIGIGKYFSPGGSAVLASIGELNGKGVTSVKRILNEQREELKSVGSHYSISSGSYSVHFLYDEPATVYIAVVSDSYPLRCIAMLLTDMQAVLKSLVSVTSVERDGALDKSCKTQLTKLFDRYTDPAKFDTLIALSKKVETVKLTMSDNIREALNNMEQLDMLEQRVEDLEKQGEMFKRRAHELKDQMWWENFNTQVVVVCVVLALIGIIIGIIVAVNKQKPKASSFSSEMHHTDLVGYFGSIGTTDFALTGIAVLSSLFAFAAMAAGVAYKAETYCDCTECRSKCSNSSWWWQRSAASTYCTNCDNGLAPPNEETPLIGAETV